MLTPLLAETGVDDHGGYQCAITFPAWTRPLPAATVLTHPGQDRTGVPPSEVANEEPYTAGPYVGVAPGSRTGPHLLVFTATAARITEATLTGPDGPVDVRFIDNATREVGEYIPPGGILVPLAPLRDNAGYAATVTLVVGKQTLRHGWSFATGNGTPPAEGATGTTSVAAGAGAKASGTGCKSSRASLRRARAERRKARTRSRRRALTRRIATLTRQVSRRC